LFLEVILVPLVLKNAFVLLSGGYVSEPFTYRALKKVNLLSHFKPERQKFEENIKIKNYFKWHAWIKILFRI